MKSLARPLMASVPMLLAIACTGPGVGDSRTASEISFYVFSALFGIVILILAFTLFLAIAGSTILFFARSFQGRPSGPDTSHAGLHIGLMAASIALFGILTSGVFVFMTLQINATAERAAERTSVDVARRTSHEVAETAARERMDTLRPDLIDEARKTAWEAINQLVADAPTNRVDSDLVDSPCSYATFRPGSDSPSQDECPNQAIETISVGLHDVTVDQGEVAQFCFVVGSPNTFRLEAVSQGNCDPVIGLYTASGGLVHTDDDGGQDLNACFEIDLNAGAYVLEVRDFAGRSDAQKLSIVEAQTNEG